MKITSITATPLSFRLDQGKTVTMGIGSTTKRDAIIVKVETSEGITGYGEAHPGRSPGAVVSLIHNTLAHADRHEGNRLRRCLEARPSHAVVESRCGLWRLVRTRGYRHGAVGYPR